MVDALFFRFYVAVEHGGVRPQTYFMRFACQGEPHLTADLVIADYSAHARMENFRTAAWAGIYACCFHFLQSLFDRQLCYAGEVMNFDHSERFEMNVWMALLQAAD